MAQSAPDPMTASHAYMIVAAWVKPQLAKLVEKAPDGNDWLHEIKFDGYRMHARLASHRGGPNHPNDAPARRAEERRCDILDVRH